jgi:hypothetical protein
LLRDQLLSLVSWCSTTQEDTLNLWHLTHLCSIQDKSERAQYAEKERNVQNMIGGSILAAGRNASVSAAISRARYWI